MLIKTNQMPRNELSFTLPYPYTLPTHFPFPTFRPITSTNEHPSSTFRPITSTTVHPSYTATTPNGKWVYCVLVIPFAILLAVVSAAHRRRQRNRTNVRGTTTSSSTGIRHNERTQPNRNVNSTRTRQTNFNPINVNLPSAPPPPPVHRNNVRLVPFTLLPQNFDFSSPQVEVRSDFVIINEVTINHLRRKPGEADKPPPYNEAMKNFRTKI